AAHTQLESLVAANPGYLEGLRLLAGTKQALGDVGQAELLLRRALEIDPLSPPTLIGLAELLLLAGRSAEAVPLLQRATHGAPPRCYTAPPPPPRRIPGPHCCWLATTWTRVSRHWRSRLLRPGAIVARPMSICRRCTWRHMPPWVARARPWRTIVVWWHEFPT